MVKEGPDAVEKSQNEFFPGAFGLGPRFTGRDLAWKFCRMALSGGRRTGMVGYWQWFRLDGTKLRSGHCENGEPTGEWTTSDKKGQIDQETRGRGQGTISEFDPGARRVPIPVAKSGRPMPWQGLVRGAWPSTEFRPKEGGTPNRESSPDPVSQSSKRTRRRFAASRNGPSLQARGILKRTASSR